MRIRPPRTRSEGFTLLEVMIAMAIMMIGFASILMVQSNSLNTAQKSKQMNYVAMLARNLMIETESKMEGKPFNELKEEESGTFEPPYEEYKWKRKVRKITFPALSGKPEGQEKSEDGKDESTARIAKLLAKFLGDALREVSITVTWSRGKGDQSFVLSTYWVNLQQEFSTSE